jgi:uncharacterized protein with PQ loop repeat
VSALSLSLGIISPALTMARGVPQAWKIHRYRGHGVSTGTWLLVLVVAELWVVYGIRFSVPAETAANLPNIISAAFIAHQAFRYQKRAGRGWLMMALLSLLVGAVVAVAILVGINDLFVVPTICLSFCLFLPQMFKVLREHDLSGVSWLTWTLGFLTGVSWAAYGVVIHQVPVWIPSTVIIPSCAVILVRLWHEAPARKASAET